MVLPSKIGQIGCTETSLMSARSRPKPEITHKAKLKRLYICEKQQGNPADKTSCCLKLCNKHEVYVISEFNRSVSAVDFIEYRGS
jgi:hypothetical protein